MQNNIIFFQSSTLGGRDEVGLIDLLIMHLSLEQKNNLFKPLQVIVPNQAMAVWVKDQITKHQGICANIDCVVLSGTVIDNLYLVNNPSHQLCDFNQIKFIIYKLLLDDDLSQFPELLNFLYTPNTTEINKLRAFELAMQLQTIFHEYLYLRTDEMLNLTKSKFTAWQKFIWGKVQELLGDKKTFLDVYTYFANADEQKLDLPASLFVFGLTSSYPSQLKILGKLANKTKVYWYYQATSNKYYGDLLSDKARSKIEKRLLRKPDLSLDDLYLVGGNPLLANLGQQSREFVELLNVNDIDINNFESVIEKPVNSTTPLLRLIQSDIRNLKHRICPEHRLSVNNDYYEQPIGLESLSIDGFYDLTSSVSSIKINVCHNRMREVQVLFNQIIYALEQNSQLSYADILITAPDIDNYVPYIQAVFDNECALDKFGNKHTLPYYITGNRRHKTYKIIEMLRLVLATPYQLTVSYLLELLQDADIQSSLAIENRDIGLIKQWLFDNHTHFGYTQQDFSELGYHNYSIYSFKQLLINLALGSSLDERVFLAVDRLPILSFNQNSYAPYDNLDNAQIGLVNKLIGFIELLEKQRELFYQDEQHYHELSITVISDHINSLVEALVIEDERRLLCDSLVGTLRSIAAISLDLPVVLAIIDDYLGLMKNRLNLSSKITCMSLQYARNLPFSHVYVLGLNFGEYPRKYQPNKLSLLASEWYLADRNYNIEDKQAFLDVILAAGQQLTLSYIGRKETDNSIIKPSPVLSLFLDVIGQSVTNFTCGHNDLLNLKYDYQNIIEYHALHPFYNNRQYNYATIWGEISQLSSDNIDIQHWDFSKIVPMKLSNEQLDRFMQVDFKSLLNTFLYPNHNLYKTLNINTYADAIKLEDEEPLEFTNRALAKDIYNYFEKYAQKFDALELEQYLQKSGVLAYQTIGHLQFEYYYNAYQHYMAKRGDKKVELEFNEVLLGTGKKYLLKFKDVLYLQDNTIIICEDFARLNDKALEVKLKAIKYQLRFRAVLTYVIISAVPDFVKQHNIEKIVIRQINLLGEASDFKISVDDPDRLRAKIVKYYIRSLSNPVLIHQGAIEEYAKAISETDRFGNAKNSPLVALTKAQNKLSSEFNNLGLEALRADAIFAGIVDNYSEYLQRVNGINDIVQIGDILAQLRG